MKLYNRKQENSFCLIGKGHEIKSLFNLGRNIGCLKVDVTIASINTWISAIENLNNKNNCSIEFTIFHSEASTDVLLHGITEFGNKESLDAYISCMNLTRTIHI